MRILMLHNRYIYRGGEDESTDSEVAMLREYGHDVDLLEITNETILKQSKLKTGIDAVWSRDAYWIVRNKCRSGNYDIVHIQNFFPLFSPSVHFACSSENVPVVQALRNYRLYCINGIFYRDEHICEDCMRYLIPWPGVAHKCYRNSTVGSSIVATMLTTHRILQTWQKKVDYFYTLSEFALNKLVDGGLISEKIGVKPNFVSHDPGNSNLERKYVFFVGRLVEEKGILLLLQTWEKFDLQIPLKIAGDGPLFEKVQDAAQKMRWIEYVGKTTLSQTYDLMGGAHFTIFPSKWYETFGRVIIESYAKGTPVISSDLGAGGSLVYEKVTGLKFDLHDINDFVNKVQWAWNHPQEMSLMGRNARMEYETKYTVERNYDMLMDIYERAIANHRDEKW
jgi:glycosyltransferase involved in cell wall biosynthesis